MKTSDGKFSKVNDLYYDEFGRPNGILLVNKPSGISSHDVVDHTRRVLNFKKVGHAGALDVFASGLLLVLVGRATKFSNDFLNKDKAYVARVVFGIKTSTQDPEGDVLEEDPNLKLSEAAVVDALKSFAGGYDQYVSIYSSVKVDGKKLRKVLREPNWQHEIIETATSKTLKFKNINAPEKEYSLDVPKREIKIYEIKLLHFGKLEALELPFRNLQKGSEYFYADIYVKCSKGTYIRQLGEDIGARLNTGAALASLDRTEMAEWKESDAIEMNEIVNKSSVL
jgi:tRNA pseudouridine55 synthase